MWSFVFCCLLSVQAPANVVVPTPIFSGTWAMTANNQSTEFTLRTAKNNQIYGDIFTGLWTGTFDPVTKKVQFARRERNRLGQFIDVQEYTGDLTASSDTKPPVYILKGTFKTIAGPGWGTPGVEYPWRADAIIPPNRTEELARLQGEWEVGETQISAGSQYKLPDETHLNDKGAKVTIHGNELIADGHLLATLANDLYTPEVGKDLGPVKRHPLMITLPNGKGVLCGYVFEGEGVQIVYPHTIGRVGSGQFIWLKRTGR